MTWSNCKSLFVFVALVDAREKEERHSMSESELYKLVVVRCFDVNDTDPGTTAAVLQELPTGLESPTLVRVEWWNGGMQIRGSLSPESSSMNGC